MNATQAPAAARRPPEKGSFPLDHYGECKPFMKAFLACMKEHEGTHIECKHLSAEYLKCRMDKGLMKPEELDNLGFHEAAMARKPRKEAHEGRKEDEGFVAGLGIKKPRY